MGSVAGLLGTFCSQSVHTQISVQLYSIKLTSEFYLAFHLFLLSNMPALSWGILSQMFQWGENKGTCNHILTHYQRKRPGPRSLRHIRGHQFYLVAEEHFSCPFRGDCKYRNLFGKDQINWDGINKTDMVIVHAWLIVLINIINAGNMMNYKHSITRKLARLASRAYLKCVALIKWKEIRQQKFTPETIINNSCKTF